MRCTTGLAILAILACAALPAQADDYYLFWQWTDAPPGATGITGFTDLEGHFGAAGEQYLIFLAPNAAYRTVAMIYRVETHGDPQMHNDHPDPLHNGDPAARILLGRYGFAASLRRTMDSTPNAAADRTTAPTFAGSWNGTKRIRLSLT